MWDATWLSHRSNSTSGKRGQLHGFRHTHPRPHPHTQTSTNPYTRCEAWRQTPREKVSRTVLIAPFGTKRKRSRKQSYVGVFLPLPGSLPLAQWFPTLVLGTPCPLERAAEEACAGTRSARENTDTGVYRALLSCVHTHKHTHTYTNWHQCS